MSSVNPSDSASQHGKKKNRPGKNARAAKRGETPSAGASAPASTSGASFFSSQAPVDPVPQPGKFPVVFRTGVGEPTRDVDFAYDARSLNKISSNLAIRYTYNPRYAEFSSNSGYDDDSFERDVVRFFLLAVAQHSVHAHLNMQLPLGDFSTLANTDVFLPTSLLAVVAQFGEFSAPSLGSRYLFRDYNTTIASLVWAATRISSNDHVNPVLRSWLPMKPMDQRTAFIVASALSRFIYVGSAISLDISELARHIFTDSWDAFDAIKPLLGDDDAARDRFDFLFSSYGTELQFYQKFQNDERVAVINQIGLDWPNPNVSHLNFSFVTKVEFSTLVDMWARKRGAIETFLTCSSGVANRTSATGSHAQVSSVLQTAGVTVVKTHVALSAPELSLLACFPPSAIIDYYQPMNVVITTSIPVEVRATEFLQLDWKG